MRCYHAGPEWTWERWQWRGTPHSPKPLHHWNLTIRLFSVISRILVRGGLPLCRGAVNVFYSPWASLDHRLGMLVLPSITQMISSDWFGYFVYDVTQDQFIQWCTVYDTKLYLMVKLQFGSFVECREPFHCKYSQVLSVLTVRVTSIDQIELFNLLVRIIINIK